MSYLVHKVDGQTDRRKDDAGLYNTLGHVNMAEGKDDHLTHRFRKSSYERKKIHVIDAVLLSHHTIYVEFKSISLT